MLSAKQRGIKYHFYASSVWLDLGLNPGLQAIGEHYNQRPVLKPYNCANYLI